MAIENLELKGLVSVLTVGTGMVLLSIPLVLKIVPRNRFYGYRTPYTLSDDSKWYRTNAYFGQLLIISSLLAGIGIVVLYATKAVCAEQFLNATLASLIVPPLFSIVITALKVRLEDKT